MNRCALLLACCILLPHLAEAKLDHKAPGFPTDCTLCHDSSDPDWAHTTFVHDTTQFPLQGSHRTLDCEQCHTSGQFAGLPTDCAGCHWDRSHDDAWKLQIGRACGQCHQPTDWQKVRWHHDDEPAHYPLVGKHATQSCLTCHPNYQARDTSPHCFTCHQRDYGRTDHARIGFSTNCDDCHDAAASDWRPTRFNGRAFDHDVTGFPLRGRHTALDCQNACHKNGYNQTATDCIDCHRSDWQTGLHDAGHLNLPTTCESCHSEAGWRPVDWRHDMQPANFRLEGAHVAVGACSTCHAGSVTTGANRACESCHAQDEPPGHFGPPCASCHEAGDGTWQMGRYANVDHDKTRFPLTGAHQQVDCAQCHLGQYVGTPTDCYTCHWSRSQDDVWRLQIGQQCDQCHNTTAWAANVQWRHTDPPASYLLEGNHAQQACLTCHPNHQAQGTTTDCYACHRTDYEQAASPNHVASGFATDCTTCHQPSDPNWQAGNFGANFDHATTGFPLTGVHQQVDCARCHTGGQYGGTPSDCFTCHWNRSQDDPWRLQIGQRCDQCHNTTAWAANVQWRHTDPPASYLLEGNHAQQACLTCHPNHQAQGTTTDCYACHRTDYEQAANPNHVASGFATDCTTCHHASDPTWQSGNLGSGFDHNTTRFPLTGGHQQVDCSRCHTGGQYGGTPTDCFTCHWTRSQDDVWRLQIGQQCDQCHSTAGWALNVQWHHTDPPANYSLEGVHAQQTCLTCHPSHQAQGTTADCYACHQSDYEQAANPNHVTSGFSTNCTSCHHATDLDWHTGSFGTGFDHSATRFPLTGRHQSTDCALCHTNGQYGGTPTDCFTCHWSRSQDDVWRLQIGQQCDQCHNTGGWALNVHWSHGDPPANYTLQGSHAQQPCLTCHTNHQAQGTDPACVACHRSDYDQTTNPSHQTSGFSTNCEVCHRAAGVDWQVGGDWQGLVDHSQTAFPLTGLHQAVACDSCHLNGQFAGTPSDCFTCHWSRSQDDVWRLQIGQQCDQCHSTAGWTVNVQWQHTDPPANYSLAGVHGQQICLTCHPSHQAQGTAATCDACHHTDYQNAANPNHVANNFATTCDTCHNVADANWHAATFGSNFDHSQTRFPLTGKHQGVICSQCHTNGQYAGTPSDCFTCHWSRSQDDVWRLQIGQQCDQCHSPTAWDANINWRHTDPPASYALLGQHALQPCLTCHPSHQAQGTVTTCDGCHHADYQKAANPNHAANGFATTCDTCHSAADPNWQAGNFGPNFDHATTGFPLVGKHQVVVCSQCHVGGQYAGTPTDCFTCHWSRSQDDLWRLQIGQACGQCHNPVAWDANVNWRHDQPPASYPLQGSHATQSCLTCHPNHQAQGGSATCDGCHHTDYQQATNPNHVTSGFSTACDQCHSAGDPSWHSGTSGPNFDHTTTAFPLTGKHQATPCTSCHLNGQYSGTPTDCFTCHWSRSQDDLWRLQIGQACGQCHNPVAWDANVQWGHDQPPANYPLQGSHASQACLTCHPNHQAQGTDPACVTCHRSLYDSTTNPNHQASGFSTDCALCHQASDADWQSGNLGPNFDHSATAFPLTGAHRTVNCGQCHQGGQYTGTPTDCYTCHWTRTQDDVWQLQIGSQCGQCHNTTAWPTNVQWNHTDPPASYALEGVHATQACLSCHPSHQAQGTAPDCWGCHAGVYATATNPNHVQLNFDHDCSRCHQARDPDWQRAVFDHGFYVLYGPHNRLACTECHASGYQNMPRGTCQRSCHNAWRDHERPHPCYDCHNTHRWGDADD